MHYCASTGSKSSREVTNMTKDKEIKSKTRSHDQWRLPFLTSTIGPLDKKVDFEPQPPS